MSDDEVEMDIDIEQLNEAELHALNHRIVQRLRFLSDVRAHRKMLEFKPGDRVSFEPDGRPVVTGVVTRYNRKTVAVITDCGHHWNVSPALLRLVDDAVRQADRPVPRLVQLPQR